MKNTINFLNKKTFLDFFFSWNQIQNIEYKDQVESFCLNSLKFRLWHTRHMKHSFIHLHLLTFFKRVIGNVFLIFFAIQYYPSTIYWPYSFPNEFFFVANKAPVVFVAETYEIHRKIDKFHIQCHFSTFPFHLEENSEQLEDFKCFLIATPYLVSLFSMLDICSYSYGKEGKQCP